MHKDEVTTSSRNDANTLVVGSYIPQPGDLFSWCDEHYWCISSGGYSGVVNPVGDTYYIRGFIWNYGGELPVFIRKANKAEMVSLGFAE